MSDPPLYRGDRGTYRDINDHGHGERPVPELVALLGERKG